MKKISIVVPVYFNDMNLEDLYEDMKVNLLPFVDDYEIIFVDDGSEDQSNNIIRKFIDENDKIRLVQLSRNFGAHSAMLAGFSVAKGDCVAIKMADLQEPSQLVVDMYNKWKEGYKVVLGVRKERNESFIIKFFSNTYYWVMRKMALASMPKGGFDCFLADKKVIKVILAMEEKNSTLMGQVLWCGFSRTEVYYTRLAREKGESKYTLAKKVKLFIDSLLSFSFFPIRFISALGVLIFMAAFVMLSEIIIKRFTVGYAVDGWASLMVINLFCFSIILLTLGIIGEYLWRTLDASRTRPIYIIDDIVENKKSK